MEIIMIIGRLECRLISKQWVENYGYVILDSTKLSPLDEENEILNDQGVNVLFSALDVNEFKSQEPHKCKWHMEEAHENSWGHINCEGGQVLFA